MQVKLDIAQTIKYILFASAAVILYLAFRDVGCDRNDPIDPVAIADTLIASGFVKPGDEPHIRPDSLSGIAGIDPVASGSGQVVVQEGHTWPDTLDFEFSIVTGPDGQPWIGAWINGQIVDWIDQPQIDWPGKNLKDSDWVGFVEAAFIEEEIDSGIGVAWTPLHPWGINIGICSTVDFDVVTDFDPEWGALGIYADKKFGIVRFGGNIGYGFGRGQGVHGGLSIGIGLNL